MTLKNRTALSAAVACCLATPLASWAQTGGSSLTVFGVVDLAVESVKTKSGTVTGISPSGNSASRLGFRGVEDLGGGLNAGFWLEAALNPASGIGSSGTSADNQNTTTSAGGMTFNRRSTVQLGGNFGEVRLGRDVLPTYWNYTQYDPFSTSGVGANLTVYSGSPASFVRVSNGISYLTPTLPSGLFGQLTYGFGNQPSTATGNGYGGSTSTADNGRYAGARLGYAQGAAQLALAYGRTQYAPGSNSGTVLGQTFSHGNFSDLNLGGAYDLGVTRLMGTVSSKKFSDAGAAGLTRTVQGWSLGANTPVGSGNVLAQVAQSKMDSAKSQKISLGYVHNLSKRTAVYGTYAMVRNSGGAASAANSYSSGALAAVGGSANINQNSTGFDFGVRHSF